METVYIFLAVILALLHLAGILSVISALMTARTAQGAIAWAMALVAFPYFALPLYWIFGRSKFWGYVDARRQGDEEIHHISKALSEFVPHVRAGIDEDEELFRLFESLAKMPFTKGNHAKLLVDGDATFEAIFEAIKEANDYILIQFFIIHDDELGRELKSRILRKAAEGVRVYVLFDEVGSHTLPAAYIRELRRAGIDIRPFNTRRGIANRLQLNFRNHRKIVIVDGLKALVGGLNVGDEYMGRDPKFGHWRDTHALFEGPSVTAVQVSFIEDWYWAARMVPELNWKPELAPHGNQRVLALPTGPADKLESCSLFFSNAIHAARERIWIVSPYFVPDLDVISSLQSAALRGVDVRVMLPNKADHLFVYLASFSYLSQFEGIEVKFYRYQSGFLHQKVILVDDDLASVGTANADNRSFRLNFEISMIVLGRDFAAEVKEMLERDFEQCKRVEADEYLQRKLLFRVGVKIARLLSPIL